MENRSLVSSRNFIDKKKPVALSHPLDDDGFVSHFIDELTILSNKRNLVIESNDQGRTYLVFRDKDWGIEERYEFEYNHQLQKYI